MASTRKKSTLDVARQWNRIFDNLERGADGKLTPAAQKRYNKAFETYNRYDKNIRNSKPYRKAFDKGYEDYLAKNPKKLNKYQWAREAGAIEGIQAKVSRSTYMGLNAG